MKHVRAVLVTAMFLAALPLGARAEDPQKVTIDTSGWFVLTSYMDNGPMNAADLPRWALSKDLASSSTTGLDDSLAGLGVRQSRFRMNVGIPNDALGGAVMKGFVEADFAGAPGSDISAWLPRLRHAYVSATWKNLNNLSVVVGQTWGVAPGPYFANSLTHIVVPRFGGAGFLFRRAPQVRVLGDVPLAPAAGFGATYTAAVVEPDSTAGEKSGIPNFEARLAAQYKQNGKQLLDVGFYGHYGTEKYGIYTVSGTAPSGTKTFAGTKEVNSQLFGVDAKLDLPYVSVLATYWQGQNLDNYYSTAPGVRLWTASDPTYTGNDTAPTVVTNVASVKTKGYMAQATLTPFKGFQIVGGYGVETPDMATIAVPGAGKEVISNNAQISGGVIYSLNAKWKIGLEFTQYMTDYDYKPTGATATDPVQTKTFSASQIELGTLLAL